MVSGTNEQAPSSPVRGTRPANRRQLIVRAAADLFYRNGYAKVGMGEVAEAVAIGPSALYRHFRGKQDLLVTVVGEAVATIDAVLATATPDDVTAKLAAVALEHRRVGVLWQREVRHLSPEHRAEIRAATKRIGKRLVELIHERRPDLDAEECDLLAWSTLAAANSVSFHSLTLPEPSFKALLGVLVTTVLQAPVRLPEPVTAPVDAMPLAARSRREIILVEASKQFARKGFTGVSMDDIGAGVGIAGPSVYNHFPAKSDILSAAVFRGDEWLRMDMNRVFAQAVDARDGLHRLLRSYCAFVFENPDLVQLLVSEVGHLPESDRHRGRALQHSYIAEWVHLVQQVHPGWDPISARIRVQAAQTIMNEIALIPHLRKRSGVDAALATIGAGLLGIPQD